MMGQRGAHVPKFGNWDSTDHMPYTVVFDKARVGKGGKPINPNDPLENPEAFGISSGGDSTEIAATKEAHELETSLEGTQKSRKQESSIRKQAPESSHAQPSKSEATHSNLRSATRSSLSRVPTDPPSRRGAAHAHEASGSSSTPATGDNPRTNDRSQGRSVHKPNAGSPSRERKQSTDGGTLFAPGTPQRPKLRSASFLARTESEKAAALPKFGDWNPKDPSAGQGFTMIFDNARNEKKTGGPVQVPPLQLAQSEPEPNPGKTTATSENVSSKWYCCFGSSDNT